MRRLRESALRARDVLEREKQPLSEGCRALIARDVAAALSEYFVLTGSVRVKVERGEKVKITLEAEAESILPFASFGGRL